MDTALLLIPLGFLLLIPVAAVLFGDKDNYPDVEVIYGGLLYIALPISLSPFVVMDGPVFDGWLLLSLFILVWISDVGAYCLGTLRSLIRPSWLPKSPRTSRGGASGAEWR